MRRYRISELGRSMVEMLGVLAIIGLLSIIGISGYKKAMNKHRANEIINLAMNLYNENLSYSAVHPIPATANSCKLYVRNAPSGIRESSLDSSILTNASSTIWTAYCNSDKTLNSYHLLILTYMTEEECEAIKAFTEASGSAHYRVIKGSKVAGSLPNGIRIYCSKGGKTDNNSTEQWW